jgi:predicted GIY-YIG superfamily endonuclease
MLCYCLINENSRKTYVGATVDLKHRLRQHNGEIKGGAKYTQNDKWTVAFTVEGFDNYNELLKFEWKLKKDSRKYNKGALQNRILGLIDLCNSGKSTKSSLPFSTLNININQHYISTDQITLNDNYSIKLIAG